MSHLPGNVTPGVYTKKQGYFDVRITITLSVNANIATSCLSKRKDNIPSTKV